MANGPSIPAPSPAPVRPRTSGVFSGLLLIIFGVLLLLHNYGHVNLGGIFRHWWPLIFIFWGAAKLYERTLAQRQGRSAGRSEEHTSELQSRLHLVCRLLL